MFSKEISYLKERLNILKGEKLNAVGRSGSMAWFNLGEKIESDNYKGGKRKTGRYALHIQSHWRIICGNTILIAKNDIFEPNSQLVLNEDFDWNSFDWDIQGLNLFDELAKKIFNNSDMEFFVQNITINKLGDLKIVFSHDFVLEVCLDSSVNSECWRFFEVGNIDKDHLVITGQGLDGGN